MKLAIFTLVEHIEKDSKYYGYAPYIREMDIWNSHFNEVCVVAPVSKKNTIDQLTIPYQHSNLNVIHVPVFNIKSIGSIFKLLFLLPNIIIKVFRAMRHADHLHFRSPSNIAAIAAVIQVFFPSKKKTMRYTGNWNPKDKQPIGYKFQKYIFSNTILTRNMTGLVYGKWENQSKNINSFFAATYLEAEKDFSSNKKFEQPFRFVYSGTLVAGKRPLLVVEIIKELNQRGIKCQLDIFGDGPLRQLLNDIIIKQKLSSYVKLHGNVSKQFLMEQLKHCHFTILPSKSEGWPKALAEGMFFGAIPISTDVSCVAWMLGNGSRGILIEPCLATAVETIIDVIKTKDLNALSANALSWSQKFTVDKQILEINRILKL